MAESYHSVGVTQHSLGNYISTLKSKKRAYDIKMKVFGEEHLQTADSYIQKGLHNIHLETTSLVSSQTSVHSTSE